MSALPLPQSALFDMPFFGRVGLALLSGLMLSAGYLSGALFPVTWFAFVPLLMAVHGATFWQTYTLGFVCGLACYSCGAYWIVDFIRLFKHFSGPETFGWSFLFWVYCAQLPALLILMFQWLRRVSCLHEWILFPVVCTVFYAWFPMLFSAQLGETQSHFLYGIQAVELVGVYGLDGMIALVNVAVFTLLTCPEKRMEKTAWTSVILLLAAWFGYGVLTTQYWDQKIQSWPVKRIGLVQPNETPSIERARPFPGYSRTFTPEMEMTQRLATQGAELVVWPEARYKSYLDASKVKAAYQHQVAEMGIDLVFQDMQSLRIKENGQWQNLQYNAAVMLNPQGEELNIYRKMKRVAFGEFVPLVSEIPWLRKWVEQFFGDFTNEISRGEGPVIMQSGALKVIPLVCYETMFSDFVAEAVPEQPEGALLVAMSSNGWFGDTVQPYQHIESAALRAVENRLPMIHALNNGPSVVVMPNGRVIFQSDYHQAGGYLLDMPYSESSGGSVFSRLPYVVLYLSLLILIGLVFYHGTPLSKVVPVGLNVDNKKDQETVYEH